MSWISGHLWATNIRVYFHTTYLHIWQTVVLFLYTSLLQYSLQLTTESDSKLSSEKKDISFQNHSDNETGKEDDITHTHNTLPIFCTCSPHIYRRLKVG